MSSQVSAAAEGKRAACLNCRKSKVKCKRPAASTVCERCQNAGTECVIPSIHVGRAKGVKNKRTGLERAIYQIEEAVKGAKTNTPASRERILELRRLINEAGNILPTWTDNTSPTATNISFDQSGHAPSNDDQLPLDDAENPLQLLARATDLRLSSPQDSQVTFSTRSLESDLDRRSNVSQFFQPMKASLDGDRYHNGQENDPIDLGLVTIEETEMLISFFHDKLAHTRWGLDPLVHTMSFVRSRSPFLLTSILAASALFLPSTAAVAKRLARHQKYLAEQVITRRLRSVEIVLAFLVGIPWMHPGTHSSDDYTGLYISTALNIALDLSLNKIVIPSAAFDQNILKHISKADCISSRKALAMDRFDNVDENSEWGRRLLRRRERAWIALFVLERGVCLARGRSFSVPVTPIIKYCDNWHAAENADSRDGSMVSMAVLRRDLDDLFSAIRLRCDSYRVIDVGSQVAREIEARIESFYEAWLKKWTFAIGEGEQKALPPYVEILVTHTRLSTYSAVINHPTAPLEVKRLFQASALSSALNVMRAAIQGEERLKSMPNNTVIMISFAACVALTLSTPATSGQTSLAPSVRNLVEETAVVLERIGNNPPHRNGASVLYGRYLQEIVRQAPAISAPVDITSGTIGSSSYNTELEYVPTTSTVQPMHPAIPDHGRQPLQFSSMSDNEIIQTILNMDQTLDTSLPDISMDDSGFPWMDWMNLPEFGF